MVALVGGPRFLRGTVIACQGETVTVAYGRPLRSKPRPERTVSKSMLYDVGAPAKLDKGAAGACRYPKEQWVACRVVAVGDGDYRVEDGNGRRLELAATDVVAIRAVGRA